MAFSAYDAFAWYYNRHWGPAYSRRMFPVIDKLLLGRLTPDARVLAVCCGTAQLARMAADRGFQVTGIDNSEQMLRYARENAPQADFLLADVRSLTLASTFNGAFCTFHAFNHLLHANDLVNAFWNTYASLLPGGIFVFDMNLEAGYTAAGQDFAALGDDDALLRHAVYDPGTRLARFDMSFYRRQDGNWQRTDQVLMERCYSEGEIRAALLQAGFEKIALQQAGGGRVFFSAERR